MSDEDRNEQVELLRLQMEEMRQEIERLKEEKSMSSANSRRSIESSQVQDKDIKKLDNFISNQKFYYSHFSSKKLTLFNPATDQIPVINELTFGERQDKDGRKVDLDEILRKHEDDMITDVINIIGDHGSAKSLTSAACANFLSRNQKKRVVKIDLNEVNLKKNIHFSQFLISFGLQDVYYKKSKEDQYNEYFFSDQNSMAIILENIDSVLTDPGKNLPYIDPTEMATPETWIKQILQKKKFRSSTIVVTSLPSSVLFLQESHRPTKLYKVSGYDEKMMETYLSQNKQASKILNFVNSQNPSIQALARNPTNLARLAKRIEQIPQIFESCPSVTETYEIFLSGIIHREKETIARKTVEFYYKMTKQGKSSFTSEYLKAEDLSVEDIAENSMLSASYIDDGNQIEYQPSYPSLMDYRIARYIVNDLDHEEYKELLDELFAVEDAPWRNIRTFICNQMFAPNCKIVSRKDKMGLMIGKLLGFGGNSQHSKHLPPRNVIETYERNKEELLEQIRQFPCWEDMVNNPIDIEKMEIIAEAIDHYNDSETIERMSSVKELEIKLASKQECGSNIEHSKIFSRFMEAMGKLTEKIEMVTIRNFNQQYNVGCLSHIIRKCGYAMHVFYDDDEHAVQQMDKQLQDVFSKLPRNGFPLILTNHQYHIHLIKQQSPVMTSSSESDVKSLIYDYVSDDKLIQLPSVPCGDDLLRKLANHINGGKYQFGFYISDRNEMKNLINLLKDLKQKIWHIIMYLPRDTTRSETKIFANAITEFNEKIGQINIYNLEASNYVEDHLVKLARKVDRELFVHFTDVQSDDDKSALVKKLESVEPPRPEIKLEFRDDTRTIDRSWSQ